MSTTTTSSRRASGTPRRSRRGLWITLTVLLVLVIGAVVAAFLAVQTYEKAMTVRAKLTSAIPLVSQVADQLTGFDTAGAESTAGQIATLTGEARDETDDPVWRVMEIVPFLGPNLSAVRAATEIADDVSGKIVTPLSSTSLDVLKPVDGKVDIAAITALSDKITVAKGVVDEAQARVEGIDRGALVPQVASALDAFAPQLETATSAMDQVQPITAILPDALGASGPRSYLVLFQNLAEAQALGGGASSVMQLNVDGGAITVGTQQSSQDFRGLQPVTVDQSALDTFGGNLATTFNVSTSRPDFPTASSIATQFWAQKFPEQKIDGVLAIDPMALQYLLASTGPVTLTDGTELTSENTVSTLLNKVYFRYSDATVADATDAFFSEASATVLGKILGGDMEPSKMLPAVVKAVGESRILAYSTDPEEQALLAPTPIAGVLPTDNDDTSTTGVFFQDASVGSKMDYYLDTAVTQSSTNRCAAGGTSFSTQVTLTNTITEKVARTLPKYVAANGGNRFPLGDFVTNVYVYGPPGTTTSQAQASWSDPLGEAARIFDPTDDLGRPVARVSVQLAPGESTTVTIGFTAADPAATFGEQAVRVTPMINKTEVTLADDPTCAG
ncbi:MULTISPECIES: DUF4012 domain-containing protein [unclassified Rathayibacter]|uniref:DUF4012 domain-containing protein n=1 Tax=unclassified Rathayibacter TaxID=2609250 RepID=UPI001052C260|nr:MULTISPECIES: DUF4012 domain-containing protein [unclassified Rathayibacter]MCJ1681607.1 DUF4012 domain-containing protein [Rathayibacter sp. VKM Ac-2928]MCJ1688729.1 DUF4012 domain-containing protein [Rathayibacter sp. VKM Ac-2927]TCL82209.1 uncharacterized protein DUF4012 [Rathayibacter sp. PhB192]TCM27425.1 uncharacterized protein DUF4012 [Rathayibacter sp. PhB179]